MSVQVDKLEKNMAKLTIEVSEDKFEAAIQAAYISQRGKISLPGFRKGKVPRHMIEKMYGKEIFFEEAANTMINQNYGEAAKESGLDIVSRPSIDVSVMESGKPFVFTAEVAVKPAVLLGNYKGVTVTKADTQVSEEEITEALDGQRKSNSRTVTVTDRPLAMGDTAVIDFEGFVDGEAFAGGKGENHSLEIGSHSFIDTFEDQLVGKNTGDELEVNVTFPEEYQSEELAGKPAMFKVKINEIKVKELPELDDEFASEISEFDTLEEYKADLVKNLSDKKEADAKKVKEDEAIKKIVETSTMEIPDAMLETQSENMIDDFSQRITQQGLTMEQYMQFSGMTMETLKEQVKPDALYRIQSSLVLEAIAQEEKFEISDEDVFAELEKMAAQYNMEVDKLKEFMGDNEKESMKKDIAIQKAVEKIMENVVEVEKVETANEDAIEGEVTEDKE